MWAVRAPFHSPTPHRLPHLAQTWNKVAESYGAPRWDPLTPGAPAPERSAPGVSWCVHRSGWRQAGKTLAACLFRLWNLEMGNIMCTIPCCSLEQSLCLVHSASPCGGTPTPEDRAREPWLRWAPGLRAVEAAAMLPQTQVSVAPISAAPEGRGCNGGRATLGDAAAVPAS